MSDEADDDGELLVKPKKDKIGPLHYSLQVPTTLSERRAAKAFFDGGPPALLPKAPRPALKVRR